MLDKFEFLSSMPSIMVVALPNFRVSSRMRIRCCSFSISPQTHRSLGSPHVEQTSAMTLNRELSPAIYKSFKGARSIFRVLSNWFLLPLLIGFLDMKIKVSQTREFFLTGNPILEDSVCHCFFKYLKTITF
jgi:hypothetical protein